MSYEGKQKDQALKIHISNIAVEGGGLTYRTVLPILLRDIWKQQYNGWPRQCVTVTVPARLTESWVSYGFRNSPLYSGSLPVDRKWQRRRRKRLIRPWRRRRTGIYCQSNRTIWTAKTVPTPQIHYKFQHVSWGSQQYIIVCLSFLSRIINDDNLLL